MNSHVTESEFILVGKSLNQLDNLEVLQFSFIRSKSRLEAVNNAFNHLGKIPNTLKKLEIVVMGHRDIIDNGILHDRTHEEMPVISVGNNWEKPQFRPHHNFSLITELRLIEIKYLDFGELFSIPMPFLFNLTLGNRVLDKHKECNTYSRYSGAPGSGIKLLVAIFSPTSTIKQFVKLCDFVDFSSLKEIKLTFRFGFTYEHVKAIIDAFPALPNLERLEICKYDRDLDLQTVGDLLENISSAKLKEVRISLLYYEHKYKQVQKNVVQS